jgi:predicted outer membrane repeat protein
MLLRPSLSLRHSLLFLQIPLLLALFSASVAIGQRQIRYLDAADGHDTPECLVSSPSVACKSLNYSLGHQSINNLELRVKPGTYNYTTVDEELAVFNANNLTIMSDSDGEGQDVVFRCRGYLDKKREFNNLAFYRGTNIQIVGVIVENCGALPAGIYGRLVHDISIVNCTFRNNMGGGVWLVSVQNVRVEGCIFRDNSVIRPDFKESVVLNHITHNSGGLGLLYSMLTGVSVSVKNCTFINNTASRHQTNADDPLPQAYVPYGHGGALIVRLSNYTNSSVVTVSECTFMENTALFSGGAAYIVLIGHPRNNSVTIRNSSFVNCSANHTGGAISIQVFDLEQNNRVEIEDSNFSLCSASQGGGALSLIVEDSLASTTQSSGTDPTLLAVRGSEFTENQSPTGGSGVGLVTNARIDQIPFVASFQDCNFTNNTAQSQGAFLTFRFQVQFSGQMVFSGNKGGAMLVFQAKVETSGSLAFQENWAQEGGAVTLEDKSWFNLSPGTKVMFKDNWAESLGGALLVKNPSIAQDLDPVYNTNCFFQSTQDKAIPPNLWDNISVSFINNCAVTAGAAIYASNITVCTYTSPECSSAQENITEYQKSIFTLPPFHFEGNMVENDNEEILEVATEAASLTVTHNAHGGLSSPGERLTFSLLAQDQSGNNREALWTVQDQASESQDFSSLPANSTRTFRLTNDSSNATCYSECWSGERRPAGQSESLEFFVIEELTGDVVYREQLTIDVSYCNPGYRFKNGTCMFKKKITLLEG